MFSRVEYFLSIAQLFFVIGCMEEAATSGSDGGVRFSDQVHKMRVRESSMDKARASTAPPGSHLTYHGGKVIQNVRVTKVLYGAGTYIPELTSTSGVNMASAYTQMTTSGVFDWLSEYDTTSPVQLIGRGSYQGSVQIAPAAGRNGSTISDASIQAEIAAQIGGGALPAPSDNQIYMVSFPSGKTITQGGETSCVAGGFCAYHGTFKIGTQNVYYAVLPALTGGCATGCGTGSTFQNQQSVASHELIEAVTDAEVGLATVIGPPLAWYDSSQGEIGDICNAQQSTFLGGDGNTYTIQKEFSNRQNDCITTRPASELVDPFFLGQNGPGQANGLRIHSARAAGASNWLFAFQDINAGYGANDMSNWKVAGDLNGDGRPDLVDTFYLGQNGPGQASGLRVHAALSTGPGTWAFTFQDINAGYGVNDMSNWKVAGDLNGDGRPDMVDTFYLGQNGPGRANGLRIHTALSTGPGTWAFTFQDINAGYGANDMSNWKVAGDLNGDGRPDLVDTFYLGQNGPGNANGLRVHTALSTGPGTWMFTFQDVNAGYGANDMSNWKVADVNGDGRPDLVDTFYLGQNGPGQPSGLRIHTLLSTGPGTWMFTFQDVNAGYGANDMANWKVMDVDGDGRDDLVDTFYLGQNGPGHANGLRIHTALSRGDGTWTFTFQDIDPGYGANDMANWSTAGALFR